MSIPLILKIFVGLFLIFTIRIPGLVSRFEKHSTDVTQYMSDRMNAPEMTHFLKNRMGRYLTDNWGMGLLSANDNEKLSETFVNLLLPLMKERLDQGIDAYLEEEFSRSEMAALHACLIRKKCEKLNRDPMLQEKSERLHQFGRDYGEIVGNEAGSKIFPALFKIVHENEDEQFDEPDKILKLLRAAL